MSIIFSATTTGFPISSSCKVKYRLRSKEEASTTLMIMSTSSPMTNWRDTCSSMV